MRQLVWPVILFSALAGAAYSACTSPAGADSQTRYDFTGHTLYYCNNTSWVSLSSGSIPAGTIAAFESTTCPAGWLEYTAARGRFLRGIDNGAGNDPDGTRTPGATQADDFKSHTHTLAYPNRGYSPAGGGTYGITINTNNQGTDNTIGYTGGTETRPKNVAVIYCQYSGAGGGVGGGAVAAVGSNNSVQYNNGGALGGSGMTYISSTDYLGIGQSAPSAKLEVNGTASATTVNTGKVLFADGTSQTTKAYTQCTTVSAGFAANAYGSVSCPAGYTLIAGGYSCACGNGCMAASTYPSGGSSWTAGPCFYYSGTPYGGTVYAQCCR